MSYRSSPRPTYDGPTAIPYAAVTRHLWGDETAGEVADWIYISNDKIHQLVFGLPPGGVFRHSDAFRTIFAADEVLYVLSGTMVIGNPETGEVHRVATGEAAFFRRDTWHHAWADGIEELRVLEYFAPPPSQGTSGAYAQTQPNLTSPRFSQDDLVGRWPMARAEAHARQTIQVIREHDRLWRQEGDAGQILVGILASTEQLTVGQIRLHPGQRTDLQVHGGDEGLYVLSGTVHVRIADAEAPGWFELDRRDGCFIPAGRRHRYYNMGDRPVDLLFGVAPHYLVPPK